MMSSNEISWLEHIQQLPSGHYPSDGCALLVRDCWQLHYQLNDLPHHANRFVTARDAMRLMQGYQQQGLLQQQQQPSHLCMVVAQRSNHWHCGIFTAELMPGYVVHTLGEKIKIEPLNQFRHRFDAVEFFVYAPHNTVSSSTKNR